MPQRKQALLPDGSVFGYTEQKQKEDGSMYYDVIIGDKKLASYSMEQMATQALENAYNFKGRK